LFKDSVDNQNSLLCVRNIYKILHISYVNSVFSIIYYNPNTEKYALSTPFWHRYLRLQHNIEAAKTRDSKRKKSNKRLLIDNNSKYQLVDKRMYEYIKELMKA